jgi:major membrane immunogen (membrane-anchored lipoprotein)
MNSRVFSAGIPAFIGGLALFAACLSGCGGAFFSNRIPDGYYTAEAASFDSHGWKEYVSLFMTNGRIVSVEYNAKNSSGLIKSWDPEYMRRMNAVSKSYPNQYVRDYTTSLLKWQDPDRIDAVTGATESYHSFKLLAKEAINQAKAGNKQAALVEIPPPAAHKEE